MDIQNLIKEMTLEEKVMMLSGKNVWETVDLPRLNIPSIMMSDGPHGLRKQLDVNDNLGVTKNVSATCFPPACTIACSFDRDLIETMGQAIAKECISENVDVLLGPAVNIKRSPLCGRNFEYYSEDPFLSGELGAAFVRGVQSLGVGTSVKHYMGNNQEAFRQTIDAIIDDRALHEIYLAPFRRIMKEKPYTVMSSYNRVNGEYVGESDFLLNQMLRKTFGFDGVVVTDWGASHDRVLGLKHGQDLDMPSTHSWYKEVIMDAIQKGGLTEKEVDLAVERLLSLIFKCKSKKEGPYDLSNQHEMARTIARESMVLLKNEAMILPIEKKTIGIIGALAEYPRYQGTGSSKITPRKVESILNVLDLEHIPYRYAKGYDLDTDHVIEKHIKVALECAQQVEIPILFIGLTDSYESEGFDREQMNLPMNQNVLVERVASVNPNVVVVLLGGSPVEMPWVNQVKGILNGYLGGESGALAIVDLLYGKANPCGKLAETYPASLQDTIYPTFFPGGNNSVYYQESIFVGYRYYDYKQIPVLFPFGYGLSYTTFEYMNLSVTPILNGFQIEFKVKNTGNREGKEICQLYIHKSQSKVFRPIQEFKEFTKVDLKPNEEKSVSILLTEEAFEYYDTSRTKWIIEAGEYEIRVGRSSQSILLSTKIILERPSIRTTMPKVYHFEHNEFEIFYGKPLPPLTVKRGRPYTFNSTMEEIKHTLFGRILSFVGHRTIKKKNRGKKNLTTRKMMHVSFQESPLRSILTFSGMELTMKQAEAILLMVNGKFFTGLKWFLKKEEKREVNE